MTQATSTISSDTGTNGAWPTNGQTGSSGPQDAATAGDSSASASQERQGNGRDTVHRWAEKAHHTIESLEQRLNGGGRGGITSTPAANGSYGERARQYGAQVRGRVGQQPLKAASIAFASGVVFERVFMAHERERVKVVEVPVYVPESEAPLRVKAQRSLHSAGESIRHIGDDGHAAAKRLGAATAMGAAGARDWTSRLWHETRSVMPSADQLRYKSQEYAHLARYQMQEHPLIAVALAVGVGAMVAGLAMWRDESSVHWKGSRGSYDTMPPEAEQESSLRRATTTVTDSLSNQPLVTGAAVIALGAVLAALIARR